MTDQSLPPAVCVVGSLTMDTVVACDELPAPGQTVFGRSVRTEPGGRGLRQAVAAARAGAEVSLIGRVGRDATGRELRAILQRERVNDVGLAESWSAPTGASSISVDAQGEHTAVVVPGANEQLDPGGVEEARKRIEGCRVLLAQLEVPVLAVTRAAEIARAGGARVVLNVAPAQRVSEELLSLTDVVIANETEARVLAGVAPNATPEALDAALAALGVPVIVVTRGSTGSSVIAGDDRWHVPAHEVDVLDTTGAGDASIGALGAAWAGASAEPGPPPMGALREALLFASAAGSLATTRRESVASIPNRGEIQSLIAEAETRR